VSKTRTERKGNENEEEEEAARTLLEGAEHTNYWSSSPDVELPPGPMRRLARGGVAGVQQ